VLAGEHAPKFHSGHELLGLRHLRRGLSHKLAGFVVAAEFQHGLDVTRQSVQLLEFSYDGFERIPFLRQLAGLSGIVPEIRPVRQFVYLSYAPKLEPYFKDAPGY
jgi:hypothetical protein